jgi:hypothetical protein
MNNKEYRMLYKAFGLKFILNVEGIAGKFNLIPLLGKVGVGFGLMGKEARIINKYFLDLKFLKL